MAEKKTSEKVKQSIEKFKAKRETDIEAVKAINREIHRTMRMYGPGQKRNDLITEELAKIEMTCSTLTDAEVVALLSEEDEEQKEYERLVDEYNQTIV